MHEKVETEQTIVRTLHPKPVLGVLGCLESCRAPLILKLLFFGCFIHAE